MSAAMNVNTTIKKMMDRDFDIRIMAIMDVSDWLENNKAIDNEDATKLAPYMTKALCDSQGQVQNVALECLGIMFKYIKPQIMYDIVVMVCKMLEEKENESNYGILSAALRAVMARIPAYISDTRKISSIASPLAEILVLASGGAKPMPSEVQVDIIDALAEVFVRAGDALGANTQVSSSVQNVLLSCLESKAATVCRHSITALGEFIIGVHMSYSDNILDVIFERYVKSRREDERCTFLRVLVNIARQRPDRINSRINVIIDKELSDVDESKRELRVVSLQAFETLLSKCGNRLGDRVEIIYEKAVNAVQFDPNYDYTVEYDNDDLGSDDEFDCDFDDIYEEDDEDDSWEIRFNAAKVIKAIIQSGMLDATRLASQVCTDLMDRFKEREEVVRKEIFITVGVLLDSIRKSAAKSSDSEMDVENGTVEVLAQKVPAIIAAIFNSVKLYEKSMDTKQLGLMVLRKLGELDSSLLVPHLGKLNDFVERTLFLTESAITLRSSHVRLEALKFLSTLFDTSQASTELIGLIESANQGLIKCITGEQPQIEIAACNTSISLLKLLRNTLDHGSSFGAFDHTAMVQGLVSSVLSIIGENRDREVKNAEYGVIASALKVFGDSIDSDTAAQGLNALCSWSQSTQIAGQINELANALLQPTRVPRDAVEGIAQNTLQKCIAYLKASDIDVCAGALRVVVGIQGHGVANGTVDVVEPACDLIAKANTAILPLSFNVISGGIADCEEATVRKVIEAICEVLFPPVVLDTACVNALCELMEAIGRALPELVETWSELIINTKARSSRKREMGFIGDERGFKSSTLDSAAQALVGLNKANGSKWLKECSGKLTEESHDSTTTPIVLRALGYATASGAVLKDDEYEKSLYECLGSETVEVASEAAFALGNYVAQYPQRLSELFRQATERSQTHQIGHLEAINVAANIQVQRAYESGDINDTVEEIWTRLSELVGRGGKGAQSDTVAKSLTVFATAFPDRYIPQLSAGLEGASVDTTVAITKAFRGIVGDKERSIRGDAQLEQALPCVLRNMGSESVAVRRSALMALYAAVQNKPLVVKRVMGSVEAMLYKQTQVDEKLVRIIRMGPFKKRVDDGLDARKAAFQCVYMLLKVVRSAADHEEATECAVRGMGDEQEIRTIAQLIASKLIETSPETVAKRLDAFGEAAKKVLETNLAKTAVKQETDRHSDVLRTTVEVFCSLEALEETLGADHPAVREGTSRGVFAAVGEALRGEENEEAGRIYKELTGTTDSESSY